MRVELPFKHDTFFQKYGVYQMYKKRGETPLEAIHRFQIEHPEKITKGDRLTYLGRLDPMAEGILLVGVNSSQKIRALMLGLHKIYDIDLLFGVSTDSADVLGILHNTEDEILTSISTLIKEKLDEKVLKDIISELTKLKKLPYHAFSSKPFLGEPMFEYARTGIAIDKKPEKDISIFSAEILSSQGKDWNFLINEICSDIEKVKGDFRQSKILKKWKLLQKKIQKNDQIKIENAHIMRVRISCSSGTYMRVLAEEIGRKIGIPCLCYRIIRNEIMPPVDNLHLQKNSV